MWYLIGVIVYLISVYCTWKWYNIAYSKGGEWDFVEPDGIALIFMFIPLLNTFHIFMWLFDPPRKGMIKFSLYKFFKVKR